VRRRLPRAVYGYVAHGAETETSLRTNRAASDHWRFVTHTLVGVSERSQKLRLFAKERVRSPVRHRTDGWQWMVAHNGHAVMARAAAEANIPFILRANSIVPLEEALRANRNTWFAAYQCCACA
jgi:L-lactate dehydrogenase (cytochrome)